MRQNLQSNIGRRLAGAVVLLALAFAPFPRLGPAPLNPPIPVSHLKLYGLTKNAGGHTSRYLVTNLSPTATVTLSASFFTNSDVFVTQTNDLLPANQSNIFNLATLSGIPNGFSGKVDISSDWPVTGTVLPSLVLTGPATAELGVPRQFLADVQPYSLTLPVSYNWSATHQTSLLHTGAFTDSVIFAWSQGGPQVVTLTITTTQGADTQTLNLQAQATLFLPDFTR